MDKIQQDIWDKLTFDHRKTIEENKELLRAKRQKAGTYVYAFNFDGFQDAPDPSTKTLVLTRLAVFGSFATMLAIIFVLFH